MNKDELKAKWAKTLQPLVGRTIVAVRYMTEAEERANGWDRAAVVMQLDDGTLLFPSADDEGNDAGALFMQPSPIMQAAGVDGAPVI
jgi:hypothetical protein